MRIRKKNIGPLYKRTYNTPSVNWARVAVLISYDINSGPHIKMTPHLAWPDGVRIAVTESGRVKAYRGNEVYPSRYRTIMKAGESGSDAFVLHLHIDSHFFGVKVYNGSNAKRLATFMHEKRVYRVINRLVELGACPFFLRSFEPPSLQKNVLITQSAAHGRHCTLSDMIRSGRAPKTRAGSLALISTLMYTLEVMRRLGLRQNDMHLHNIMMLRCERGDRRFTYVKRDGGVVKWNIPAGAFGDYQMHIFDLDRATKLSASNRRVINSLLVRSQPYSDVVKRWPWYDPTTKGDPDALKVLTHIRRKTDPGSPLHAVVSELQDGAHVRAAMRTANMRAAINDGYDEDMILTYHIAVKNDKEANYDRFGSIEKYLLQVIGEIKHSHQSTVRRGVTNIDMRAMYA